MAIRITYRVETIIETNDISEAAAEFRNMELPQNCQFVELVSVEDDDYNDIMSEFNSFV